MNEFTKNSLKVSKTGIDMYLSPVSFWWPEYLNESAWIDHAPFAFWLMETLKPRTFVELGTHGGYSYFSFCQAVNTLKLETYCYAVDTWKGDEHTGSYGEEVFKQVQDYNERHYVAFSRLVRSTFDEALAHFSDGSIDLLHIDGQHFYKDVKHDFESWRPKLSKRSVVLFHDTNVRERNFGVFRLWEELQAEFPTFEFLHGHGLGVIGYGSDLTEDIKTFFEATANSRVATEVRSAYGRLGASLKADFDHRQIFNTLQAQIVNLDGHIASLKQLVAERDAAVALVTSIRCSTSWRITAPLRFGGHLLRGDFTTIRHIVSYIRRRMIAFIPERFRFFLQRQLDQLLSLTGSAANSTANSEAIAAIISERCAFTQETPVLDPLTACLISEPPSVDISVVTYNSSRWVNAFIESLRAIDYPKSHIIVRFVDNSSADNTVETLQMAAKRLREEGFVVDILQRPNRGFGAGHNVAIKAGSAPFCLITNIDLAFERDTLTRLIAAALADVAIAAAWEARQKPYEHPKFYDPVTGTTNWNSHACVLLRRTALEYIGGYDETLFVYGEDVEMSYRLRRAGFVLRYCPSAVVLHYCYEETDRVKPLQYSGSMFANLYLRLKYGNLVDMLAVPPMSIRLVISKEIFPGSRYAVLRNLAKLVLVTPKVLLLRRRSKAYFPFRTWDYEMIRDGPFVHVPSIRGDTPLVSIITRTYSGREVFLRQALLSVAHQSYSSIEHIVVEDGGDTMRGVVDGISRITGRHIRFIGLNKVGRSAAGNAGLEASSGRWCLFLDDDDLLFGDHIEVLVNALHNEPDAVAAYSLAWEVLTTTPTSPFGEYREVAHDMLALMRQEFDHEVLSHHNFMPIQSVLFERRLFIERGGFENDMDALEDWILWNRYAYGNRFIYVPKVTSLFRTPSDPAKIRQRQDVMSAAYPSALARVKAIHQHTVCE